MLTVLVSIFFGLIVDEKKNDPGFAGILCEYMEQSIVAGVAVASYDECFDEEYSGR